MWRIFANDDYDEVVDRKLSFTILFCYVILVAQFLIRAITNNRTGEISDLIKIAAIGMQGFLYLKNIRYAWRRSARAFLLLYPVCIIVFLFTLIIYPENSSYVIDLVFPFFFACIPSFIYTYSINDYKNMNVIMEKIANIVFILCLVLSFFMLNGSLDGQEYSLGLSYYLLFPLLVFTNRFIKQNTITDIIRILVILMVILFMGSRGAIMCFVFFCIGKMVKMPTKSLHGLLHKVLLILGSVILAFSIKDFLKLINYYGYKLFGISSRTITLLLTDLNHASGRDVIYRTIIEQIKLHPILGIGIAGDRRVMNSSALYAHNIFLEILADYGVLLGIMLILSLLACVIKGFLKEGESYDLALFWVSIGLVPLLVSESYLQSFTFWIMLAILIKPMNSECRDQVSDESKKLLF